MKRDALRTCKRKKEWKGTKDKVYKGTKGLMPRDRIHSNISYISDSPPFSPELYCTGMTILPMNLKHLRIIFSVPYVTVMKKRGDYGVVYIVLRCYGTILVY